MNILFFSYDIPWPLTSGGKIRSYNLIKELSKKHNITLYTFYRNEQEKKDLGDLKNYTNEIIYVRRRGLRNPLNFLISAASTLPFAAALYHPLLKKQIIHKILAGKFDLLNFDSLYPAILMDSKFGIPQVLSTLNAEHLVYQGFVEKQLLPVKTLLKLDVVKLRRYEETRWKEADVVTAVSEDDAEVIEQVTGKQVPIVPNGVDVEWFKIKNPASPAGRQKLKIKNDPKKILFVGDFTYFPNRDAVNFLLGEVWPIIESKTLNPSLVIAGRNIPEDIKKRAGENIIIRENVPDIRGVYNEADVLLVPLRMGSGTKFKVLEAMASKLPVVTTSIGAEGLGVVNGKELLIEDNLDGLANKTLKILENPLLAQRVTTAASELVERRYSWTEVAKKLDRVWTQTVKEYSR